MLRVLLGHQEKKITKAEGHSTGHEPALNLQTFQGPNHTRIGLHFYSVSVVLKKSLASHHFHAHLLKAPPNFPTGRNIRSHRQGLTASRQQCVTPRAKLQESLTPILFTIQIRTSPCSKERFSCILFPSTLRSYVLPSFCGPLWRTVIEPSSFVSNSGY